MSYKGLHGSKRKILATILAKEKGVVSIDAVVAILGWKRKRVRELLSSLARAGWLKSVTKGLYIPVPLQSDEEILTDENSLVLASYLYKECYLSAWSAASFWGLTDQIFTKTWVMTQQMIRKKEEMRGGHIYILKHTTARYFFGIAQEMIGQDTIYVSDPHKTVIDLANFIDDYGLQSFVDIFEEYLRSEHKNLSLLMDYAEKSQNKTVFKRIGFMLERLCPDETNFIEICRRKVGPSVTSFDPKSTCDIFSSKWNLRIPKSMEPQ